MSYFNDATGEYDRPVPRSVYCEETGETYYEPEMSPCRECGDDTEELDIGQFQEQGYTYCESCWLALPACAICEAKIVDESPIMRSIRNDETGEMESLPCHEDCGGGVTRCDG